MRKVASHAVPFSGCAEGRYEATWAQQQILKTMHSNGRHQPAIGAARAWSKFDGEKPLPSVADYLRSIRVVVGRHDALRTHYLPEGERRWFQSVVGEGSLLVDEYVSEDDDLELTADRLVQTLAEGPFAQGDLPLRCAVLTASGRIRCFAMAVHHASADGAALAIMSDEIRRLCADASASLPAPTQPRQIAELEMGPAQQRHAFRADQHHRSCMRQLPVYISGEKALTSGPVYHQWVLDSAVVARSARVLGHRHGVSVATAMLSAYAIVAGQRHGRQVFTARLPVSNRHGEFRNAVVNLFQTSPLSIDLRADLFGSLCHRVAASCALAYRYGHYDPDRFEESRRQVEEERGVPLHLPFRVSIQVGDTESGSGGTAEALRDSADKAAECLDEHDADELRRRSRYRPSHGTPVWPDSTLKFDVWRIGTEATLTLGTDSEAYDEGDLLRMLHAFEDVLVKGAVSPGDVTVEAMLSTAGDAAFHSLSG